MGLSETCDCARRAAAWRLRSTRHLSEFGVFSARILISMPLSNTSRTHRIGRLRGDQPQTSLPLFEYAASS